MLSQGYATIAFVPQYKPETLVLYALSIFLLDSGIPWYSRLATSAGWGTEMWVFVSYLGN